MNFSIKSKGQTVNPDTVRFLILPFFIAIFLVLNTTQGFGQERVRPARPVANDSLRFNRPKQGLNPTDTVKNQSDSTKTAPKGDITSTITYSATDSINSSIDKKIMRLYGNAHIKYGDIELEANEIIIDYNHSTLYARGSLDSSGRRVGFPVFTNGAEQYETKEITYNFKTRKAKIFEVVTQQGDGLMHSDNVIKTANNQILARRSAYTTCDLPDPHFSIISTKAKAIPGDKVVSGPFYMEFNHVPLPVGFAFGMFPSKIKATSGILMPTYGEEARRGFFLRGGGYYFNINEFLDLTLTGDVYTKGSTALNVTSKYVVRYKFGGNFNFAFTNNRQSSNIEDKNSVKDFRISWSHTPQTKGTGRFSASVNAATSSYTNNNYLGVNTNPQITRPDNTTTKMNSNISYSKTFPAAGITLGLNMRHSQDLITRRIDLPLPDLSMNVNNLYPFRKIAKGVNSLENINIRISTTGTNQITNSLGLQPKLSSTGEEIVKNGSVVLVDSVADFNLKNLGTFFKNAKKGVRHTLPLATSIKLFKYLTVSPSISLTETWYFDKLEWGLDSTRSKAIIKDTIRGFNRISNYSFSVGVNTRIYGTKFFKEGKRVQAIRHVMNPSISYSLQPDFTDEKHGYFQKLTAIKNPSAIKNRYTDGVLGPRLLQSDMTELVMSRHQGYVYGGSSIGRSSTMSFSLNNSVEMKVKGKKDTVAKKVSLLNALSIGSGYNFLAKEYKLSPFSIGANTNVLDNKVNLNFSASLDPYTYRLDSITEKTGRIYQTRIDRYVWKDKFSLGQISSANFAFSTNFNPKGNDKDKDVQKKISQSNLNEDDKRTLLQNTEAYVDFSIPWNLRLNYNVTYSKQGLLPSTIVQSLRINGDFSLSEKWKIQYNTGYDIELKEFTQTSFSLTRDLHCWTMSLNWVPFGRFQSYNFFIGIKSSLLKDLKVNRTRSFFDLQN